MSSSDKLSRNNQSAVQLTQLESTSTFSSESIVFRWKIKVPNYGTECLRNPMESPIFNSGEHSQYSWKLSWRRDRYEPEDRFDGSPYRYYTVSLDLVAIGSLLDTQFNNDMVGAVISFKGRNEQSLEEIQEENKKMYFRLVQIGQTPTSATVNETELLDTTKGYIVDNKIAIYCHIHLRYGPTHSKVYKSMFSGMEYEKELNEAKHIRFDKSEFSDVMLVTRSKNLPAHKFILAAQSPVFAAMFRANMLEATESSVEIMDFEPEVVEAMVEYLYTGSCVKIKELSLELFGISDKYQIMKLKQDCERESFKNLSVENAVRTLLMANLYCAATLKAAVIDYIIRNKEEVRKTQDFQNLKDPSILVELFLAI